MSNGNSDQRDRIYWQQWSGADRQWRRDLRTSSVSIRLSDQAQAQDVAKLMRQTLDEHHAVTLSRGGIAL